MSSAMCAGTFSLPAIAVGLIIALPVRVSATSLALDFEEITAPDFVLNFYNGGFTAGGQGPGPAYGVTFSSNAQVISPGPPINPSHNKLQIAGGETMFVNIPSGLDPLSFYYSTAADAVIAAWDGPNGTGNILASKTLRATIQSPEQFTNPAGTRSFTVTTQATFTVDPLLFSTESVVPEPSSLVLTVAAVLLIAGLRTTSRRGR